MARSSKTWVGLDLGSTGVRAVKLRGVDDEGFAIIERFALVPMRGDAIVAGKVRNPQLVAQAAKRALKAVKAPSGAVVVGLTAAEQGIARIALPAAVRQSERLSAIKTMQVQIAAAVPMNDAALSANFVREESTADGRRVAALLVAAALEHDVDLLTKVCQLAGFEPRAVDLAGAGTLRALVRDLPGSRDNATIVDIGATTTTVITREGLYLRSSRGFTGGGIDLTRAIAGAARESLEDAERHKFSLRLPTQLTQTATGYGGLGDDDDATRLAAETAIERALGTAADLLVDQIAQTVESDALSGVTRNVALCGQTALLRVFKERLQRRLGVEVRIGHPWARLERSKLNAEHFHGGREDPRLMLALATATGLALWRDAR